MRRLTGPLALTLALLLVPVPAAFARPRDKLAGGLDELAQGKRSWAKPTGPAVRPLPGIVRDGKVLVDVYVKGAVRERAAGLRGHGMRVEATSARAPQPVVEGWIPLSSLDDVAALDSTRAVVPVGEPILNTGSVTSEGDARHRGPEARALSPTGAGIPVGIMSDSINKRGGGVAASQASGDLPANVQILSDPGFGTDEGRAMAEVVYDTAPGIPKIIFATGIGGPVTRANNIDALVAAGAKVIADDVVNLSEPFFQDGVVAQAADRAKASGTAYLVSAGNRARQSWEGVFTPVGSPANNDFDPGAGSDTRQTVATLSSASQQLSVFLQWDDPFGAVTHDYALDVYDSTGTSLIQTFNNNNIATGIPAEGFTATGPLTFTIAIRRVAGTGASHLKWIANGQFTGSVPAEYAPAQAIDPDAASARGTLAVAAVRQNDVGLDTPESFSSRGPAITRYFDKDGNPLSPAEVRPKPDIAAADGVAVTPGFDVGTPDLNPFFGTSAAAPSAAGVAALVLSARPSMSVDQLYSVLKDPTGMIDCTATAGQPDGDCGWGFLLADGKLLMLDNGTPPAVAAVTVPAAPDGANGWFNSTVGLTWNVTDPDTLPVTTNCGPQTIATDGVAAFTCTAQSVGGTTSQPVTIMRDATPPATPAFTGIRQRAKLRRVPRRLGCRSSDATSGLASCKVGRLKPGKHRLRATATDVAGLTSRASLIYTFTPRAASRLAIPKQSLGSVLTSGLKCTLLTVERRTKLTATLKSGNTIIGQKTTRSKRAGKTTLKVPLNATGLAALRDARRATLSVSVTAESRHTRRAKLRAKRTLRR